MNGSLLEVVFCGIRIRSPPPFGRHLADVRQGVANGRLPGYHSCMNFLGFIDVCKRLGMRIPFSINACESENPSVLNPKRFMIPEKKSLLE